MPKPPWYRRLLIVAVTAALVPAALLGGSWLLAHPPSGEVMRPVLLVAGVAGLALGARRSR
ncbi:MAG: hypothetical protein KDI51_11320 [Xanthomonadales bacterium]|nr:hypothetical protein [Xanthomonadales bacterium]